METTLRFSANINTFNACADRYVLSGYGERLTTEELIKAATQVEGLIGVEVVGLWHVNDDNLEQMQRQIKDAGLEVTCVTPDIWASGKWGWGSFSSNDPQIRRDAIHEVKKSMEWAKQLNCEVVDLWFGQDGYDYPLQADYLAAWDWIIEGTIECAEHVPEVKLVIEYKPKEPRTHCFIGTVGKTLLLVEKVNKPNVGAMIDVGHALMAYENAAESAAMLQYFGQKLFYMHFNDNWRLWDAFTPIINLPEAAILGVGRIQPKPVVRDGEIVVRQMWTLSLVFDHRLVDGAPAARFLQRIKQLIENPYLLLG